jgi:hypothetical protein
MRLTRNINIPFINKHMIAVMNKRNHYFFMAVIMIMIDFVIGFRFDIGNGWVIFMACFFGAVAGIYFYAAITAK